MANNYNWAIIRRAEEVKWISFGNVLIKNQLYSACSLVEKKATGQYVDVNNGMIYQGMYNCNKGDLYVSQELKNFSKIRILVAQSLINKMKLNCNNLYIGYVSLGYKSDNESYSEKSEQKTLLYQYDDNSCFDLINYRIYPIDCFIRKGLYVDSENLIEYEHFNKRQVKANMAIKRFQQR